MVIVLATLKNLVWVSSCHKNGKCSESAYVNSQAKHAARVEWFDSHLRESHGEYAEMLREEVRNNRIRPAHHFKDAEAASTNQARPTDLFRHALNMAAWFF